jgi:hypothetical protein
MNSLILYCNNHLLGDQECWTGKLWRTWLNEQFIQNFGGKLNGMCSDKYRGIILKLLLIIYHVIDWIQLTHDYIQWSALTGVEKSGFLKLQITSSLSNNCLFCASGRASRRVFSCLLCIYLLLVSQVKGADRVKTFENNGPKRGGRIEIIS